MQLTTICIQWLVFGIKLENRGHHAQIAATAWLSYVLILGCPGLENIKTFSGAYLLVCFGCSNTSTILKNMVGVGVGKKGGGGGGGIA